MDTDWSVSGAGCTPPPSDRAFAAAMARPRDDRRFGAAWQSGKGGAETMAIENRRRSSPADADRRSGSIRRRLRIVSIAFLAALQIGAFVGSVQAAKFDEKIKAPVAPSNAELQVVIRDYFATYARVNGESAAGMARDKAAYQQWFETNWRLQRAIDKKQPLVDLMEFGVTPNPYGSYS